MKPSEVHLTVPPLTGGAFPRAEVSAAVAIIVRASQVAGDRWRPLTWAEIQGVMLVDIETTTAPFDRLFLNPFFRPNIWQTVELGFAEWLGKDGDAQRPIQLTPLALTALEKWARGPGRSS